MYDDTVHTCKAHSRVSIDIITDKKHFILEFTKDHEGDDQSVQTNTFRKTYEDQGFTEHTGVLADCAKGCACYARYGNTTTDTG